MPIENEIKIILSRSSELIEFLIDLPKKYIEQYYCDGGRVRSYGDKYVFTFKKTLPDFTNLEIETEISKHDFDIFKSIAKRYLKKTRYYYENCEIDVFEDGLIMCEIEGDDHTIPNSLKPFVKKIIKKGNKKYSSKTLSKKL